jgi:hypothetical protein
MDGAEHVSTDAVVKLPPGKFKKCLKVKETTLLKSGNEEFKL